MVKGKKKVSDKPCPSKKDASRVEFLAIESKIDGFVDEGYSWKAIHDFFKKNKNITMSYDTFCKYMNGSIRPIGKQRNQFRAVKEMNRTTPVKEQIKQEGQSQPVVLSNQDNSSFTKKVEIPREEIF